MAAARIASDTPVAIHKVAGAAVVLADIDPVADQSAVLDVRAPHSGGLRKKRFHFEVRRVGLGQGSFAFPPGGFCAIGRNGPIWP
jgi:hypothetical protein